MFNIEIIFSEVLQSQMKNIFVILFQRLSSSKTTKFIRELIVFVFFCIIKYGASFMIDLIDSIQNGFVFILCKNIILYILYNQNNNYVHFIF